MPYLALKYEVPQLLVAALRDSPMQDTILARVEPVVQRNFDRMVDRARELAPEGATGDLRKGIRFKQTRGQGRSRTLVRGRLTSKAPHTVFVEKGTRPHRPPVDALKPWALKVLGDENAAWAVAALIEQRGTAAQRFFERTEKEIVPGMVQEVFESVQDAIEDIKQRAGLG